MRTFLFCGLLLVPALAKADIVISEIMYHPASENTAEEYIELHNTGAVAVDLSGWRLTSGVELQLPAGTQLAAGASLAVVADPAAFHALYPSVTAYLATGGWAGQLSNSGEKVTLQDAYGTVVDSVSYADDGDWAERRRDALPDFGHRGWTWYSAADGGGSSLELIRAGSDNATGQNWASSSTPGGTPGSANSVAAATLAPRIAEARHFPVVPGPTDSVTVTCRVTGDLPAAPAVQLHFRNDGDASYTTASMADDGAHGDALPADGFFGAQIPARADGTVVEYYITASDGTLTRTWPAPARDYTGTLLQYDNCLYQVDSTAYSGHMPLYRIIMRAADRTELNNINTDGGTPPFPFNPGEAQDQTESHARFSAAFVSADGTGVKLRYRAGVRNRGNGSRNLQPQSLNVSFQNADTWNGLTALNLNTQNTPYQMFGSALYRLAGIAAPESRAVQVRLNRADPTGGTTSAPSYGFYVCNEVQNPDFAAHHFPLDSSGNIYRGQRLKTNATSGGTDLDGASLEKIMPAPGETLSLPDLYKFNYRKETNNSEDNWTDLIALTTALAKGHSGAAPGDAVTFDADFVSAVEQVVNVPQWMRWMAVQTMADNSETNLSNGDGDDFYIYFGTSDPRAVLLPFDLDTVFGRSSGSNSATHSIFAMVDAPSGSPTPLNPFMKHPAFAPLYYAELIRLLDGPFAPAAFAAECDNILGGTVASTTREAMKTFNQARHAYVTGQVPRALSVTAVQDTAGTALTQQSGYARSTAATCRLTGRAHAAETRSVKVRGATATWSAWEAKWTAATVTLTPGLNRVLIQSFDAAGAETERTFQDVWYDDSSVASVSGALSANTTWTAAGGPYQLTAGLTVNSGVTLTIQPGASIYLNSGVTLTVAAGGRILAEGTEASPIRFTRAPGLTTNGGTITVNGQAGAPESRFVHTFFEFGGDPALTCAANSNVVLDHCEWLRNTAAYLHLDGGSFLVSDCIFPSAAAGSYFEAVHGANAAPPAGGRAIIRGCFFGKANSISSDYNDVFDFTGGNRPGPILQFYDNVMIGSDDDLLDIDGTDMWIENNVFMHVHRSGSPDSASAVSGGNDGGGGTGSRRAATAIDSATDQITCGTHGFTTGQEVVATALLGNTFPPAVPALHNGGPYYVRAVSTTVVKLYASAAAAAADTGAVDFTGGLPSGSSLSLCRLSAISHITMTGNIFYDVDQAATAKEGNFYTFLGNTVISQNQEGSQDAETGVLNFGDDTYHEAGGGYAEGNIIHSAVSLTRNYPGAGLAQTVTWKGNIFPQGAVWTGAGTGNISADAQLVDPVLPTPGPYDYKRTLKEIRRRASLQPCSPARRAGPSGTDCGAIRPQGVSIGGAPQGTTSATSAVLQIGTNLSGNGIPSGAGAWQNGSGWTHYRYRLDGGAWSAETPLTTPVTLSGLTNGVHTVEAAGRNDAGTWQDSADLGELAGVATATWTVDTAYVPPAGGNVRISEILALNTETRLFGTTAPDIIELHNPGPGPADLTGWGLTDNASLPYKYTFPALVIPAGGYHVIYSSGSGSVPQPKTGFGLKREGDTLTLTRSAAAGGGTAESVPFGWQLPDMSAGRCADGSWTLCLPTIGTENAPAPLASPAVVKINEWLADAAVLAPQDFVELHNPAALPVNIGGCRLTDNIAGWPGRNPLRQLTFLAAGGYTSFKADSDPGQGPEHLNFKLNPLQGEIGLSDAAGQTIDTVVYGPQTTDISQGRTPNGSTSLAAFTQPTPGGPNPGVSGTTTTTVPLVTTGQEWRYRSNGSDHSADFYLTGFNDSGWTSAPQLHYIETATLSSPSGFTKQTQLPGDAGNSNLPYNTVYFRTRFTYTGPLTGVTLTAKVMIDDGAIFYLNGQEILPSGSRLRMPAGTVTFATTANSNVGDAVEETLTFDAAALQNGENILAVEVHQQHSGTTQSSSDVVFGMKLDAQVTASGSAGALVINEVLAENGSVTNPDGSTSGWIELANGGATAIDAGGMSLSDDAADPRKFVIPAGTSIPAGGYHLIYCNPLSAPSGTNTGWALAGQGGTVYLFNGRALGGGLHDSISYGRQIPGFPVGRVPDKTGLWRLTVPTAAALNSAAAAAAVTNVKLNEWKESGGDFLELFNTASQPVALAGLFLTDDLLDRQKFPMPPLSFIGGAGPARWQTWTADNDNGATPAHLNFAIEPGDGLGLYSAAGVLLDTSSLIDARPSGTTGRLPDGTGAVMLMADTPGAANATAPPDTDGDGLPDAWEQLYGLNIASAADATADGDHDGLSNLAEFASGTNPQSSSSASVPAAVPGGDHLRIQFRRSLAADHLRITVQLSPDLSTWLDGSSYGPASVPSNAVSVQISRVPDGPDAELITVEDTAPISTLPRRFVRVRITP